MFGSNAPKTKSSSTYISTSSGTGQTPFIRTPPPRKKSCTQPRTRIFSIHKILLCKFPKSGILRKRWKAIYFSNFVVKDLNFIYQKKKKKVQEYLFKFQQVELDIFTKDTNISNIIFSTSESTPVVLNYTSKWPVHLPKTQKPFELKFVF